jgi:hypothetical protein
MTDSEAEELFQGIIGLLQRNHALEIIHMIENQIAEGICVEDEVRTYQENKKGVQLSLPILGGDANQLKPSGKSSFVTIVPYTPKERLALLLNILEQTFSTPSEMRGYLQESFLKKYSLTSLAFISPSGEVGIQVPDASRQA